MLKKIGFLLENSRNYLILGLLGVFLLLTLWDRGGIHYPSFLGLAVLLLPISLLASIGKKKDSLSFFRYPFLSLLGAGVFFILSYAFSLTPNYGFTEIIIFVGGGMIMFLLSRLDFSESQVENFLRWLIVLAVMTGIVGMYFYLTEPFNRLAGTFRDFSQSYQFFPNALANLLLMVIPLDIHFCWRAKGIRKLIYIIALVFLLACLILTFSRGAFLVISLIFFGWMVLSLMVIEKSFLRKFLFFILVILAALTFSWGINDLKGELTLNNNDLKDKLTFQSGEKGASISERLDFWRGALLIMKDFPLFGTGPDSFRFIYPQYQKELLAFSDHPHNILLKVGAENGFPALIFFAGFLLLTVYYSFFYAGREKELEQWEKKGFTLKGVIFIGLAASLSHNFLDYNFNFVTNFLTWWILLGFLLSLFVKKGLIKRVIDSVKPQSYDYVSLGIAMIALVFFIVGISEGYHNYVFRKATGLVKAEKYEDSLSYFDQAEKMIFKRNYYADLALAYNGLYKRYREEKWVVKAQESAAKYLKANFVDAWVWNFMGELELKRTNPDFKRAVNYFKAALILDSLNSIRYHLDLWQTAPRKKDLVTAQKTQLRDLVSQYMEKLKINAHLTVLTDNPPAALKLCQEVFSNTAMECRELNRVWKEEMWKFEKAYK